MKFLGNLKTLPVLATLAFGLSLSPAITMADNSEHRSFKQQHSRDAGKHHNKEHRNTKKNRHHNQHDKHAMRHKPHHGHRKQHHEHGQRHHRGHEHYSSKPVYRQHRHHNGHAYYTHQHGGRHYNHRHYGHSISDYVIDEPNHRYYLGLYNQRLLFGLHTDKVDIIYGR